MTDEAWIALNGSNTSNPTVTALDTMQLFSLALHPRDPNLALTGAQDNGTARFDDNIGWIECDPIGGDGDRTLYDFDNPLHAIHVLPLRSTGGNTTDFIRITDDGGLTWHSWSGGSIARLIPSALLVPAPLIIDPSRSQRYFIGTDQISISEDGGDTWGSTYRFAQGANALQGRLDVRRFVRLSL